MKLNKRDYLYLEKLLNRFDKSTSNEKKYPLLEDGFTKIDIIKGIEVLLGKKITMSNITKKFEYEFGKFIGSKYCLMVNSGSSANLLAFQCIINPYRKKRLKINDEVLIPAVCWSTSFWPIVQSNLKPVFVDVNTETLNIDEKELEKKITKKTRAIMLIHVLGNSANMKIIMKIKKKYNLILIEDTCESFGSFYQKKYLGNFGDFGTYSFYYSHQITSGEGGMIICNDKRNYKIIHTLRAHGWDRGIGSNKKNFNFVNSGFNVRPSEISAAIGYNQFKRLNKFKKTRSNNRKKIIKTLKFSKKWNNQFTFIEPIKNLDPSWFGLPILINKKFLAKKKKFLNYLNNNGIETRPILSGNFINQPSIKLYKLNNKKEKFKSAQEIEDRGFFIGIHIDPISKINLQLLENKLLNINEI